MDLGIFNPTRLILKKQAILQTKVHFIGPFDKISRKRVIEQWASMEVVREEIKGEVDMGVMETF